MAKGHKIEHPLGSSYNAVGHGEILGKTKRCTWNLPSDVIDSCGVGENEIVYNLK
jgi:hypothetical protein